MRGASLSLTGLSLCALLACRDFGEDAPTNTPEAGSSPEASPEAGTDGASPANPLAFLGAVELLTGLVGYWRFDDALAATPIDTTNNLVGSFVKRENLKLYEASLFAGDATGHSIAFARPSAVQIDPSTKTRLTKGFTLGALVRQDVTSGNQAIIGQNGTYQLWMNGGVAQVSVARSDGSLVTASGVMALLPESVHLLVATFDNDRVVLTVDGSVQATQPFTGPPKANEFPVCLGAAQKPNDASTGCEADRNFDGRLDEVFVAAAPATQGQIEQLATLAGLR